MAGVTRARVLISISILAGGLGGSSACAVTCADPGSGDFTLCYVDRTGIQIAMAWDEVAGAPNYVVERATSPAFTPGSVVAYTLPATVTGFGDTGWPLTDARRFMTRSTVAASPVYHLATAADYYYRVRAGTAVSNVIGPHRIANFQDAGEVVRGVAGDLWADVVLGRPRFGENTWWKTDPYGMQGGGGVAVDRYRSHPTHVFILDGNRNRILAMEHLGVCSVSGAPCSIPADCDGETCTPLPGQVAPYAVLGQPSAFDYGACNGDGTAQTFPNPVRATASTLCSVHPTQISMGETVIYLQPVVDAQHNLYVPDEWNHRVLMYRDPFNPANGTAAAAVWGQAALDDLGRGCASGPGGPPLNSLCRPLSVDIDPAGNLWVVDAGNSRVLRFPYDPTSGEIAATADIALTGFLLPRGVRSDLEGNVYVSDEASVITKFSTPQPGQPNTPQPLAFLKTLPYYGGHGAAHFDFDPTRPMHVWVNINHGVAALVDLAAETTIKRALVNDLITLGVSQSGDLFTVTRTDGMYRLGATETPPGEGPGPHAFPNSAVPTLDSMMSVISIAMAGDQLLVSDRFAVYFWNDYRTIVQGAALTQPADGMWGLDPSNHGDAYVVKSDTSGRIWIGSRFSGVKLYAAPLTATSAPIKTVSVSRYKNEIGAIVPLPANVTIGIRNFLPEGSGDRVWVADENHSRVLRVVNLDGEEAPGEPPYVDVVLGQADWWGAACNKGGPIGADTLCTEAQISFDPDGNLYVQENASGGQDGGGTRLLRWNRGTIPDHPSQTLFNPLPDRVYGNGAPDNFSGACAFPETACTVRAAAFAGDDIMVLGANPYAGSRFPMVYLNKEAVSQPQLALGDMLSFPSVSYVDPDGNLYLGDYNWQRVLVYKSPFAAFAPLTPRPTSTPASTRTPTATPTSTPTPTVTPEGNVTDTFTPLADEGIVGSETQLVYATARATSTTVYTGIGHDTAGAYALGSHYYVYRSFLAFDTSSIPDTHVIESVTLSLRVKTNAHPVDFDINVRRTDWPSPLTVNREAAYDGCLAAPTEVTWANTATLVAGGWRTSPPMNPASVSTTGVSRYCLISSFDADNIVPTQITYVETYSRHSPGNEPVLTVVHRAPTAATPTDTPAPTATQVPAASPTFTTVPTPTGTRTPSPTPSPTPTSSATPVATGTPTATAAATATPAALCAGAHSPNPCIAGGGPLRTDCHLEWVTAPIPALRRGLPTNHAVCFEGDPGCDVDSDVQNASCTFAVRLCLSNRDPRLPACVAPGISRLTVIRPSVRSTRAADRANRETIEVQAGSGSDGFGLPVFRGPAVIMPGSPNLTPDLCSAPLPIVVPLRQSRTGKRSTGVTTLAVQVTATSGQRDTDRLRLSCRPAPQ